jgi:hypothetical protein
LFPQRGILGVSLFNMNPDNASQDARCKAETALELATFKVPIQRRRAAHAEGQTDDEPEHRDEDLIGTDYALISIPVVMSDMV